MLFKNNMACSSGKSRPCTPNNLPSVLVMDSTTVLSQTPVQPSVDSYPNVLVTPLIPTAHKTAIKFLAVNIADTSVIGVPSGQVSFTLDVSNVTITQILNINFISRYGGLVHNDADANFTIVENGNKQYVTISVLLQGNLVASPATIFVSYI